MARVQSAALLVVVVVVSALAWWWPRSTPASPVTPVLVTATTAGGSESTILVHVSGAVAHPGVVVLESDARVIDAVTAAGGVTAGGVPGAVNLAAPVADGDQVVVPSAMAPAAGTAGDGRVSVNSATEAELEDLPGVGPVMARRIVDHRTTNGSFVTVEDLLDVPGIGEATLARLRPLVRIP